MSLGDAAHITAAAPGGPRYDPTLTPEQRRSPENGIWACTRCARLIDSDKSRHTVEQLRTWKAKAEARALRNAGKPMSRQSAIAAELEEQRRSNRGRDAGPVLAAIEGQLALVGQWSIRLVPPRIAVAVAPHPPAFLHQQIAEATDAAAKFSLPAHQKLVAAVELLRRCEGTVVEVREWVNADGWKSPGVNHDSDYRSALSVAGDFLTEARQLLVETRELVSAYIAG